MQKSYECEVATHIGPESCGAARKGGVEALTGERAGRVFSRVRNSLRDADAVGESGRPHRVHRFREVSAYVHGVSDRAGLDRKSTRLNSSHLVISYAVFCLKKKKEKIRKRKVVTSRAT